METFKEIIMTGRRMVYKRHGKKQYYLEKIHDGWFMKTQKVSFVRDKNINICQ